MRAYYFGCARGVWGRTQAGHELRGPGGAYEDWRRIPWGAKIDGELAPRPEPRAEAPQGEAALAHKDGWTAIAFWDRTGDRRGASNSAFVFDAELDFDAALAAARAAFPELFDRFDFEVVPYIAR